MSVGWVEVGMRWGERRVGERDAETGSGIERRDRQE